MRITLVTETFPPEVNGVARTLSELVAGLVRRGHGLEVIRPRQPRGEGAAGAHAEYLVPGLPLPYYRGLQFGLPVWSRLLRRWRAERPDVVHVATEGPLGLAALSAARTLGIPVASSFHTNFDLYGNFYNYGGLRRTAFAYLRWFHNRAACTMPPTAEAATRLTARGFRNVQVLGRGVDVERFSPRHRSEALRERWGADAQSVVVAYVGRVAEEKNLGLVVRSFEAVRAANARAACIVVGDGPALGALRAAQPELVFCGMRVGEDLSRHYASADLVLFPSLTETFGNVVLEGMASGLAVLAFDAAAARLLLVHEQNGLKTAVGADALYVEQAVRAASAFETCRRLGAAARKTALEHSWETIVGRLETLLTRVVEPRTSAGAPVRSPQKNGAPARL